MRASSQKQPSSAAASLADRRREERTPVDGEVILAPDGPRPVLIHARLLDISASGFRASHSTPNLETGARVHFRHAAATGLARIVWNRNSNGSWESGFLILTK
ncbi:MAG: PilZ domain-containing protein [Bryobacteraceae bacterium]